MNVSFAKVKNPVLRWFAGFGVIIGCAAALEGLILGRRGRSAGRVRW